MKKITELSRAEVLKEYGKFIEKMVVEVGGQDEAKLAIALLYNVGIRVLHSGECLCDIDGKRHELGEDEYGYLVFDTQKEAFVTILENKDAKLVHNDTLKISKLKPSAVEEKLEEESVSVVDLFRSLFKNMTSLWKDSCLYDFIIETMPDEELLYVALDIFYGKDAISPNGIDTFDDEDCGAAVVEEPKEEERCGCCCPPKEEEEPKEEKRDYSNVMIGCETFDEEEEKSNDDDDDLSVDRELGEDELYDDYIDEAVEYIWNRFKNSEKEEGMTFTDWAETTEEGTRAFRRFTSLGLPASSDVLNQIVDTYLS